jgi:hypothetical protein
MYENWANEFWSRVKKARGSKRCWEWTGSRLRGGYGYLSASKKIPSTIKTLYAHRVSWEIANDKPIPEGLEVRHSCNNAGCVNPAHLSVGTHQDNERDKALSRINGGDPAQLDVAIMNYKLAPYVVSIRAEYAAGGVSYQALADRYDVAVTAIGSVVRRASYRHL